MRLLLGVNTLGDDEVEAALAVLKSGSLTMEAKCREFEETFSKYFGVKNCIFVNSGSSANLLAFFALANPQLESTHGKRRLNPGDEVIVPAVTWSTTLWPIVQAGGVPVLVDSDPETLQMNLGEAEQAITPKTVAICPVHVLGNAVPYAPIDTLATRHRLWVIEDTCESLGTRHRGQFVGTSGDIGTFSFFLSHHITTIEGGMIVTDDDGLAELFRCLRAHGWTRQLKNRSAVEAQHPDMDPRFLFVNTGFNVRSTEINAVLGIHQLARLDTFNKRRRQIAEAWSSAFADLIEEDLFRPMKITPGTDATWFGYPVICANRQLRDEIRNHLETNGVETRPIICGNMARQPALKLIPHRIHGSLAGADRIMDCGLYWGSHPLMTDAEVEYLIRTIRSFFKRSDPS